MEGARVGVHQVGSLVHGHGWSIVAVAGAFDLTADEIAAALDYYEANPDEMDAIAAEADAARERLTDES